MTLNVQTVAQSQVPEFVLAQASRQEAARLVAKLRHALVDQSPVREVVAIHVDNHTAQQLENANYLTA